MQRIQFCFGDALAFLIIAQTINNSACIRFELANYSVLNFLQDVQHLHPYEQLLYVRNRNATAVATFSARARTLRERKSKYLEDLQNFTLDLNDEAHFISELMTALEVPLLLHNEQSGFTLQRYFSAASMVVVYLEETLTAHYSLLDALVASLKQRTQTKILFLINIVRTTAACDDAYLQQLFQACWLRKLLNVLALCSDYKLTGQFHSYSHFPHFALERKRLSAELLRLGPIYPYRLGNLGGYNLTYIIGGTDPRIILYNINNRRILGGSAGHFLTNFARKHNCTLHEPLPVRSYTRLPPSQEVMAAVRNNSVDISVALTYPTIPFDGYTYPYDQVSWCLWSPIEADIANFEFFWIVFEGWTFLLVLATILIISFVLSCALWLHGKKPDLLRFFIHDACLRGVMAQSFREQHHAPTVIRFIYLQIYVLGMLLTTSYNSYFAAYWTSAPKHPPLRSYDDILHSDMKILVFEQEFSKFMDHVTDVRKYIPMFQIESDFHRYLETRDKFSTKYIYLITTNKWRFYMEQQKYFTKPLFRMRWDLCFYHNIPMGFPIHDNSIFLDKLNDMILETAQSGLTEYWQKIALIELIRSRRLTLFDLSHRNEFKAMKLEDLKLIWIGYGVMCLMAVFVFLAERYYFRR